jgi:hypothetical protein
MLLMAFPAHAGTRALFNGTSDPKELLVEVSDDGAVRVGAAGRDEYGLLLGDQFYLIGPKDGKVQVARVADMAAAFDKVMPPIFKDLFGPAGDKMKFAPLKAVKTGTKTVAGIKGDIWSVKGMNDEKPDEPTQIVVSNDPRLAPIGRALCAFFDTAMIMMRPFLGNASAEMVKQNRQLFALGTPIESAERFTLIKLETADSVKDRFTLPAKPATIDEIVAGMKVTPTN